MTVSRFAITLAPIVAAALSAAAAVAVACWVRVRHLAPVAEVYAAGYRAGGAAR